MPYSQKSFFDLTGIDYEPQKLILFLSGLTDLLQSEKYSASINKSNIILESSDSSGITQKLWWNPINQTLDKIEILKNNIPASEIEFSDFQKNEIGFFPEKIYIKEQNNFKLKFKLTDIVINPVLSQDVFIELYRK